MIMRAANKMHASASDRIESFNRYKVKPIATNKSGNSRSSVWRDTRIGVRNAVTPRIRAILVIFEPIALPIAKPLLPCHAETPEISNSGAEVPKPIMTTPITNGEILKFRARPTAPMTKRSALQRSSAKPISRPKIMVVISLFIYKQAIIHVLISAHFLNLMIVTCSYSLIPIDHV